MKCCLCGKEITDFGNNPWPLRNDVDDRCCDDCNMEKVIPARLAQMRSNGKKRGGEQDGKR